MGLAALRTSKKHWQMPTKTKAKEIEDLGRSEIEVKSGSAIKAGAEERAAARAAAAGGKAAVVAVASAVVVAVAADDLSLKVLLAQRNSVIVETLSQAWMNIR